MARIGWSRLSNQRLSFEEVDAYDAPVPLNSSNLSSARYNALESSMEIQFHNGSTYRYRNVEPSVFQGLIQAASPGAYLFHVVRPSHPAEKV